MTNAGILSGGTLTKGTLTGLNYLYGSLSGGTFTNITVVNTLSNYGLWYGGTYTNGVLLNNTLTNQLTGGSLSVSYLRNTITNTGMIIGGTYTNATLSGTLYNLGTLTSGTISSSYVLTPTIVGGSYSLGNVSFETLSTGTLSGNIKLLNTLSGGTFTNVSMLGSIINNGTITGGTLTGLLQSTVAQNSFVLGSLSIGTITNAVNAPLYVYSSTPNAGGWGGFVMDTPNSSGAGATMSLRNSAGGDGAFACVMFDLASSSAITSSTKTTPALYNNNASGMIYCKNSLSSSSLNNGVMGFQVSNGTTEVEAITIVPTGSGVNVGINNTTPLATLDVNGSFNATGGGTLTSMYIGGTFTNYGILVGGTVSSTVMSDSTVNSYVMGNLGLGTRTPTAPLQVISSGGSPLTNGVLVYNSNASSTQHSIINLRTTGNNSGGNPYISVDVEGYRGWSMGMDNNDNAKFKIANWWNNLQTNTVMTLNSLSNNAGYQMGINTSSPTTVLDITTQSISDFVTLRTKTSTSTAGYRVMSSSSELSGAGIQYDANATTMTMGLYSNSSTINPNIVINSSNKVGIFTASPVVNLDVNGSMRATGGTLTNMFMGTSTLTSTLTGGTLSNVYVVGSLTNIGYMKKNSYLSGEIIQSKSVIGSTWQDGNNTVVNQTRTIAAMSLTSTQSRNSSYLVFNTDASFSVSSTSSTAFQFVLTSSLTNGLKSITTTSKTQVYLSTSGGGCRSSTIFPSQAVYPNSEGPGTYIQCLNLQTPSGVTVTLSTNGYYATMDEIKS